MSLIAAFLLSAAGFAALCLSMQKHQRAVLGASLPAAQSRPYRWAGFGLIIAATVWCMVAFGWARGLTVLCGIATVASIAVIVTLTLQPQMLRPLYRIPRNEDA
ncbi:MAG: DUF3325 domain-containing protein [Pseudomonadota bacterium]